MKIRFLLFLRGLLLKGNFSIILIIFLLETMMNSEAYESDNVFQFKAYNYFKLYL